MTQLRAVRKSLTTESIKTLLQAFIASRLDYWYSVFHGISVDNLQALQSVLNSGARRIMRKWKYEHITAILRGDLHWLPIRQRITYKLCTIVYKCLYTGQLHHIWQKCVFRLLPALAVVVFVQQHLSPCRTRTITYVSRSFTVSGPRVWNDLSPTLHSSSNTLGQFQSRLKTTLFRLAYGMWLWRFRDCLELAPHMF